MRRFAVVVDKEDFIICIAIKDKYDEAVIEAYDYMNDCIEGEDIQEAVITPLRELEGETGTFFKFRAGYIKATVYILVNEG